MKNIKLLVISLLSFLSIITPDLSFAMNPDKRSAEEGWEQQGDPTRPHLGSEEEEEDEEKEEYDEKEEESDADEDMEREDDDEMLGEIEALIDGYEDLSQAEKNKKLLEVADEDLNKVDVLLSLEADPNVHDVNNSGKTPLFKAAEAGRLDIVNRLLQEVSLDVNAAATGNLAGATPLWAAILNGHTEVVRRLLEDAETTVSIQNPGAMVRGLGLPLWAAINGGDIEIVKLLLETDIDRNAAIGNSFPLFEVILKIQQDGDVYTKIAELLLEYEADVNQAVPVNANENAGETSLYKAIYYGFPSVVRLLLANGADFLERPNNDNAKMSFYVARDEFETEKTDNFKEIYNMLLDKFEETPFKQDVQGNTVLHYLVEVNDDIANAVIKDLLEHGGNLLEKNNVGETALSKAVEKRNANVIRWFIDPTENDDPWQAFLIAIENGLTQEAMRLLKDYEIDVNGVELDENQVKVDGVTPLMKAAQQNDRVSPILIDQLLQNKADIHQTDNNGKTALVYAAEAGKEQAFRRLLARGAGSDALSNVTLTERMQEILDKQLEQGEEGEEEEEERVIDLITQDDITDVSEDQKITLGQQTYLKKSIMDYILSKVGTSRIGSENNVVETDTEQDREQRESEQLRGPLRNIIEEEVVTSLANHFNIPSQQLLSPPFGSDLQQIPTGMDEQTYLAFKYIVSNQALGQFRNMIAADTLRSLDHRLQKRENNLQMYPDDHDTWEEGERSFVEREVGVLKEAIKSKLQSFGYEQE